MRTLLAGALAANLAGCSHQPPPVQTAADSCASRNPLACFLSVRVSTEPMSPTTNPATPESKPAIARKAREAAVTSGITKHHPRADVKNVGEKSRDGSLMAAR
jgi:hypothetical protein